MLLRIKIPVFHKPFSTFPLHSAEKASLREKSFTEIVLDIILNFSFSFRLSEPLRRRGEPVLSEVEGLHSNLRL